MGDDDFGSEIDDELDSDLEEARDDGTKKKKKKSKENDDDDLVEDSPKKKKPKKDPNKPKRAHSAYIIYSNENRERIKKENPTASFGDVARLVSASYKKLSKDELVDLEKKVNKQKERYA